MSDFSSRPGYSPEDEASQIFRAEISAPSDWGPGEDGLFLPYREFSQPVRVAPTRRRRRVWLPVLLFVATCLSTFWAGATHWSPDQLLQYLTVERVPPPFTSHWDLFFTAAVDMVERNWREGFVYMAAVLGILLTHEMGHFIQAVRHHIPASLPFFIPIPITPLGTMGAVIGMEGMKADRKQLFDIGLTGPLAGLVLAVPITCWGILEAEEFKKPKNAPGVVEYHDPLVVEWLIDVLRPDLPADASLQLNALLMAGWVGMLITGLNMMPVSQLDGGHVTYALFGKGAHTLARLFLIVAIAYIVYAGAYMWILMVVLVMLIGPAHPPTANDEAPLGRGRWLLGLASLSIPLLCFPVEGITIHG